VGHAELDGDHQHQDHDEDEGGNAQQGETAGAQNTVHHAVGLAGAAHGRGMAKANAKIWLMMMVSRSIGRRRLDGAPDGRFGDERGAQVAPQDVFDPDEILLDDGFIEPELPIELGRLAGLSPVPRITAAGSPGSR
jgi:hypothetical protein